MKHYFSLIRPGLLAAVIALTPASSVLAQHDDHGTDHSSGSSGHSGGKGKKGPKYMGGQKGESHSHEGHTGGPHQGGPSRGGSKHTEDKIFHGHEDHEGGEPGSHESELPPEESEETPQ